ncbi:MAG: lipopolysaccharide heptosyltransferase II [Fluviibacter sp.]
MKAVSLLVAPAWVGDAVMSEPLIRNIAAHDHAPVDVLAPPWVAPLFERMPNVGQVIAAPFAHGRLDFKTRWRLGQSLKAQGYQNAYILPNSLKSALPTFFAGIPNRIGFTGESRYGLVNRRQKLDKQKLPRMVDRFLALGPKATVGADTDIPQLSANPGAFEQLKTTLGLTIQNRLAILCPGAEYGPAKRWPVEHFATLTRQLHLAGYTVWTFGSAKDQESGSAIESLSGGIALNLCGRTKLADAIDLMSRADIVVSNDSGLMHVAAALQRPLIALFGSSSPRFTPPLSKQVDNLQHAVPCSPCFARTCRYGHMDCLTQLLPETVMASIHMLNPESITA